MNHSTKGPAKTRSNTDVSVYWITYIKFYLSSFWWGSYNHQKFFFRTHKLISVMTAGVGTINSFILTTMWPGNGSWVIDHNHLHQLFSKVSHKFLDKSLAKSGDPVKVRSMFPTVYSSTSIFTFVPAPYGKKSKSDILCIRIGVVQGDITSPLALFYTGSGADSPETRCSWGKRGFARQHCPPLVYSLRRCRSNWRRRPDRDSKGYGEGNGNGHHDWFSWWHWHGYQRKQD